MGDLLFKIFKVSSPIGDWLAAFDNDELIFLGSYEGGKKLVEGDLAKHFKTHYGFNVGSFTAAKWTKGNFWKQKHKIKLQGTDFQVKVWLELLKIPRGKTLTYSQLASKIRKPSAVRAVSTAIGKNPICYYIPCHRVMGKGASKLKYHYGPAVKKSLLVAEGALDANT